MPKNVPTDVFKHINMHGGDKDVCWEWTGKVNKKDGRPYFTVDGKRKPSYNVVLELSSGETQEEALANVQAGIRQKSIILSFL